MGSIRTTASNLDPSYRLSGLDGLRALAALGVFGVHFNQVAGLRASVGPFDLDRFLANGNTGVALFFVLSGFLLSLPFWRNQYEGVPRVSLRAYFLRRLARIVPAYYLCMIGLLLIKPSVGSHNDIENIIQHLLFVFNFDDRYILSLNEPFWTLAVEVQFYALLPFAMLVLTRFKPVSAFLLTLSLSAAFYFLNLGIESMLAARAGWPLVADWLWPFTLNVRGPSSSVLTYSTLAHMTFFFVGIAASLVFATAKRVIPVERRVLKERIANVIFWAAAAAALIILATPLDAAFRSPGGRYNWPVIPLLLALVICVVSETTIPRRVLEWRPLRLLGVISYGIYIFHLPIQKFVAKSLHAMSLSPSDLWWVFGLVSLFLTVLVSAFSFVLIEKPVISWARRFA